MAKKDKPDAQPEELKDLDSPAPEGENKRDPEDGVEAELLVEEAADQPEKAPDADAESPVTDAAQDNDAPESAVEALTEDAAAEAEAIKAETDEAVELADQNLESAATEVDDLADRDAPKVDGNDISDVDPEIAAKNSDESVDVLDAAEPQPDQKTDDGFFVDAPATDDAVDKDRVAETSDLEERAPAETAPMVAAAPASQERRGGFVPMFLGGVAAAVIGFLAGQSEVLDGILPDSFKGETVDLAPIEARLDEQAGALETAQSAISAEVSELATAIETLAAEQSSAPAATTDDSAAMAAIAEATAALEALTARIEALEARPQAPAAREDVATTDDVDGLQAALSAQNEALAAQQAELEALAERARLAEENATLEAQKVLARAALTRVTTAVDNGGTFEPALSDLEEVTPVTVPDDLRAAASEGITTLAELQAGFPPAARAALDASRAAIPESEVEGIGGFIKRQLSVRSVVPREGDDPDAILSRAEAAVRGGDLAAALGELAALPEVASTAMQDWLDQAAARQAALDAVAALTDSLSTN